MRSILLSIGTLLLVGALATGCGESSNSDTHEHAEGMEHHDHESSASEEADAYQCPMKCEGDKTYAEKGKCPVCGMDLKEVEEG